MNKYLTTNRVICFITKLLCTDKNNKIRRICKTWVITILLSKVILNY